MKHLAFVAALAITASGMTPVCAADAPPIAIVIHGGAGVINRSDMTSEREAQYRSGL